jgi:flagellin FlaB
MKANNKILMKKDASAQVGIGTLIIFIAMVLVAAVAAAVLIQTSGVLQQKAQATGKQATQEVSSNLIVKNVEGVRAKVSASNLSTTIDLLKLNVGLNVGSAPVDVNQVVITITDGTTTNNLVYAGNDKSYASTGASDGDMDSFSTTTAAENLKTLLVGETNITGIAAFNNSDHYFSVLKIRDEDASFSQDNPVMNTGDLITVYIATTSSTAAGAGYYTNVGTTSVSAGGLNTSALNLVTRTPVSIVLTPEAGAATVADFMTPSSFGVKETVALYP